MSSIIQTSVSVSLGSSAESSGASAKAEVCGSNHQPGGQVGIKLFLPTGYSVAYIANSMEGVGGAKVTATGKSIIVPVSDDLKFDTGSKTATLGYQPKGVVSGKWIGMNLGAVGVTGMTATLGSSDSSVICPVESATSTAFVPVKRGIWRATYDAEAKIYIFYAPSASALQPFGDAPYPVEIEFQCVKNG